jgi:hypothetical protein
MLLNAIVTSYPYDVWSGPIKARVCSNSSVPLEIALNPKISARVPSMTCKLEHGVRSYELPPGIFEIDEQLLLPANTSVTGASSPNDMANPTFSPDWSTQTLFLATRGATAYNMSYCSATDMVHTRVGFILSSFCTVRDISYQGIDTIRPADNGWLCGGGAFETKGCAATDCGDSTVNNGGSDGVASEHVTIDNVRVNDFHYPADRSKIGAAIAGNYECSADLRGAGGAHRAAAGDGCCFCQPNRVRSTQTAVWIPDTRDAVGTRHLIVRRLVSRSSQADGINLHGRVRDSLVEDCYVENTGDDIYVVWGGLREPANVTFRRCVAVTPGVTRPNWYGNCVATGGAGTVAFTNITCRAPTLARPIPAPGYGALRMDTSCAWFHTSFNASYPPWNRIVFQGWRFEDLAGAPYTAASGVMNQPVVGKMAWTRGGRNQSGPPAPFYFPEGNVVGVNVECSTAET